VTGFGAQSYLLGLRAAVAVLADHGARRPRRRARAKTRRRA
jgi:hypothetical protein